MSEKASGRRERGAESRAWLSRTTHPISSPNQGKTSMQNNKVRELANFIWGTADTLRGKFKAHDYGKVILPFFVLRRLDCLLSATQDATIEMADSLPEGIDEDTRDLLLFDVAKAGKVYNLSPLTFAKIKGQNPADLHDNLVAYITGFSANMRDIFIDKFKFLEQLKELKDHDILWDVFEQFTDVDLSPSEVSNLEMGYVFEELIRRFSEQSNETAGEHFTPREVVHLIVDLLIANDKALTGLRSGVWHGRHPRDRRSRDQGDERGRARRTLRAGAEQGILRDLPLGHVDHRSRPGADRLWRHARQ